MTDYWKDRYNANALKFPDSPLKQVEATVYGREVEPAQLNLMLDAIVRNLALSNTDHVADLCCGNGLMTRVIAQHCKQVDGVDFSENLIRNAQALHAASNIEYSVSDVCGLPETFCTRPNKGYMCYALQHLPYEGVERLLRQVARHKQWTTLFISGIPDKAKLAAFYDNEEKIAFYQKKEALGEPHLGKWWEHAELETLVHRAGMQFQLVPQPAELFTSHYRFDCLIHNTR